MHLREIIIIFVIRALFIVFSYFCIKKRVENVPENLFFIIGFQLLGQGIVSQPFLIFEEMFTPETLRFS